MDRLIHTSNKTIKWIYVEDKQGNHVAKQRMPIGDAFQTLKDKGYLVATKLHTDSVVVFRIY